jgi:hypothetical protein
MDGIKSVVYLIIAMASLFLILAIIVIPFFNTSYQGACKRSWVCSPENTTYGSLNTCDSSTRNSTTISAGYTGTLCPTMCIGCTASSSQESWGTAGTGAVLLIFFMALIGLAIKFMPMIRK